MTLLLSPNAMKGSLTAFEAAWCMQAGIEHADSGIGTLAAPVADGGNGTLDCLVSAIPTAEYRMAIVQGPVGQSPVPAEWGLIADRRTAIIEMAEASGLHLITEEQRDVLHASTYGTGQLIVEAWNEGCTDIILGLGGSATNDGGTGCMRALGIRFLDAAGEEIAEGGAALAHVHSVDLSAADPRLGSTRFTILTDVENTLCGINGASYVFGPQKGAAQDDIILLDGALSTYASVIERMTGRDVACIPGAGAAGGFGAGLLAFCAHARFVSGIEFILDAIGFDALLESCDAVLTSEGMIDSQTEHGKAIAGICKRAKKANKPVHAFVGRIEGDASAICRRLALSSLTEISPRSLPLREAIDRARELLTEKVATSIAALVAKSP